MTSLQSTVAQALQSTRLTPDRFQEIVLRLLDTSVICFADSQAEAALYNDATRVETLLTDYFSIMGCRLFHDRQFQYFRLYAPGATIPGVAGEADPDYASLRLRLNQHEAATALILRFLYDKALIEGRMDDDGRTSVVLEEIHTALKTTLDRSLPVGSLERRSVLRRMKQLKLIDFRSDDDLDQPDTFIVIRPLITSFVHADLIQAAGEDVPATLGADRDQAGEGDNDVHG